MKSRRRPNARIDPDDASSKYRRDACGCSAQLSLAKLAALAGFGALLMLFPPQDVVRFLAQARDETGTPGDGGHSRLFPRGGGQRTRPTVLGGAGTTPEEQAVLDKMDPESVPLSATSKLGAAVLASGRDPTVTFDEEHELCGDDSVAAEVVAKKTIALIAITYKSPLSLGASMRTWRDNGLLDMVDERILFINAPSKADFDIGNEFGFKIMTTDEHGGNVMAGPALAYAVGNITSDYVLFMEKDFHLTADRNTALREMWAGVWHMARGVEVYRLRGKTDHPAEGMPDCCTALPDGKPSCPFNSGWRTAGSFADHMNWLFVFCDPDVVENANGRVVQCSPEPRSLCFTSAESNWSNNPVMFGRKWFNRRLRKTALEGENAFTDNRMLEFEVMLEWLPWRPPARICASYWGIFEHVEIDQ